MHEFPHRYTVAAIASPADDVTLEGDRLPRLVAAPPEEFGGPGDLWSPEALLAAAVASCFVLTFRAIARGSRLAWLSLRCDVEGTLDRVDRVTRFTAFRVRASLRVPAETSIEQAEALLERAERGCLISNSLSATVRLECEVELDGAGALPIAS